MKAPKVEGSMTYFTGKLYKIVQYAYIILYTMILTVSIFLAPHTAQLSTTSNFFEMFVIFSSNSFVTSSNSFTCSNAC